MIYIGLTQRVIVNQHNERCDQLDQRWVKLLEVLGFSPIPIPNRYRLIEDYLNNLPISGIILTGGNNLSAYGGDAPERDDLEEQLITICIKKKIPMLGVCRGMQAIIHYHGGILYPVMNHVKMHHRINFENMNNRIVNSYHTLGVRDVPSQIMITARADDSIIEAVKVKFHPIYGIMWHPEREEPFENDDIRLFKEIFDP